MRTTRVILMSYLLLGCLSLSWAGERPPWGTAGTLDIKYAPGKVLYDVTSGKAEDLVRLQHDGYAYLH